jgi:hypothetical protein
MTASPSLPQTAPQAASQGIILGAPVNPTPVLGPLQVAFKPSASPLETAKLGTIEFEQPTTIPMPPAE